MTVRVSGESLSSDDTASLTLGGLISAAIVSYEMVLASRLIVGIGVASSRSAWRPSSKWSRPAAAVLF